MPSVLTRIPESDRLVVDVFFADEDPDRCALYCAGQVESLQRHFAGRQALTPGELGDACIVLARGAGGRALGGMRVHLHRPGVLLPIERALGDRCAISQAIARASAPLVELCGTWVGTAHRGSEVAGAVMRAALDVARAFGARTIVGHAHQHILDFYRRYGAVVDPTLGVHPYPDARYETSVVWAGPEAYLRSSDP
jgi:hypothetical protein